MRIFTLLLATLFISNVVFAGANEPCKKALIPSKAANSMVVFEMPTYEEYIENVVIESLTENKEIDASNVLDEETFNQSRAMKIGIIKEHYVGSYAIMTQYDVQKMEAYDGFIFKESIITDLVSESDSNFEKYTMFVLSEISTFAEYHLADPSTGNSENCLIDKTYKFEELISQMFH